MEPLKSQLGRLPGQEEQMLRIMNTLVRELPLILYRDDPGFEDYTGVTPKQMHALEQQGNGPKESTNYGRVIGYPKRSVLDWVKKRYFK